MVGFVWEMNVFAYSKIAYHAIEDTGQVHKPKVGLVLELIDKDMK